MTQVARKLGMKPEMKRRMAQRAKKHLAPFIAMLHGKRVSDVRKRKRYEICRNCDNHQEDRITEWCGLCGCAIAEMRNLLNLAAVEERPGWWGCEHPDGSKWKDAGV